eukprot:754694-Hanusia_phi.AAC.9
MADDAMILRLENTARQFEELTSQSRPALSPCLSFCWCSDENPCSCFNDWKSSNEELEGANLLFQASLSSTRYLSLPQDRTEEFDCSLQKIRELEERLKVLMLPKDPNDERDVMVLPLPIARDLAYFSAKLEIRAGTGGDEV